MRSIRYVHQAKDAHWVGNGFPVSTLFSYQKDGAEQTSPFLLLDYAGPVLFAPAQRSRGVGKHPHKGFETVTLVYQGELEHRDSAGHGGTIGPGDVQWMTAGAGIEHEEFHSAGFTKSGGMLEMVQLWVNLPAHAKSTPATYQSLTSDAMPKQPLGNGHSAFRVIAGEYEGTVGPAKTHSDLLVMDLELHANEKHVLHFNPNWNVWLTLLTGTALVNGQEIVRDASIVSFQQDGEAVHIEANNTARFLVTAGAPINEPVVGYGPFVMNSWNEIKEAIAQFS